MDYPNGISSREFQSKVLKSERPVLVLFVTDRGFTCRDAAKTLQNAVNGIDGIVDHVSINADEDDNHCIAREYGVTGVPSLLIFKGGKEASRLVGNVQESHIQAMVNVYA